MTRRRDVLTAAPAAGMLLALGPGADTAPAAALQTDAAETHLLGAGSQ